MEPGEEDLEIREEALSALADHARISIAYETNRVLDVVTENAGVGGIRLLERRLARPFAKDYDAIPGEGPRCWADRFDVSSWGLLAAIEGGERVGGAVLAHDSPGVDLLRGRRDLAALWDLRVRPGRRGAGIGSRLFRAAEVWARARGCRRLLVETQNVNVAACRFYARMGCELGAIDRFAYPELPGEVRLDWVRELASPPVREPDAGAGRRHVGPPVSGSASPRGCPRSAASTRPRSGRRR